MHKWEGVGEAGRRAFVLSHFGGSGFKCRLVLLWSVAPISSTPAPRPPTPRSVSSLSFHVSVQRVILNQ